MDTIEQLKLSEISMLRMVVRWRINALLRMGHAEDSRAVRDWRDLLEKLR